MLPSYSYLLIGYLYPTVLLSRVPLALPHAHCYFSYICSLARRPTRYESIRALTYAIAIVTIGTATNDRSAAPTANNTGLTKNNKIAFGLLSASSAPRAIHSSAKVNSDKFADILSEWMN